MIEFGEGAAQNDDISMLGIEYTLAM